MANLASGIWRDGPTAVVVVVENHIPPTPEEWDEYVAHVAQVVPIPDAMGLALTDGAGPDSRQRSQINVTMAGRRALSAVITTSMAVRGIVTALRWFNPDIDAFHPDAIRKAMRFLRLDEPRAESLWSLVTELDQRLEKRSQVVMTATAALRGYAARTA